MGGSFPDAAKAAFGNESPSMTFVMPSKITQHEQPLYS